MASHQRPQLNVDMRLVIEEERIRMPVTSKKRRLRYALLDDESSQDDDDDFAAHDQQQQAAGEQPYEQEYRQSSSYQPQEKEEEQFVLPSQDASSFSSSESDNDEEDVSQPRDSMQHSSALHQQYEDEDDLFDAAFVAPENRSTHHSQHCSYAWNKENTQQVQDYPSLNQSTHQQQQDEHEVVDLCASDDDDDDEGLNAAEYRATFQGVRTPSKSPRFNEKSRSLFSPNARSARLEQQPAVNNKDDDDDIVECWSSEDEGNQKPRAARRVTNIQEPSFHQSRNSRKESTFAPKASLNVARRPLNNEDDDDDEEPAFMPAPTRPRTGALNRYKTETVDRRRRLRDATTGFNTAASVMLRSNNAPLEQASDNLWYRQSQATASTSQTLRNDLMGGSGVGAGNYTFTAGQSFQQSFQQPVNPLAATSTKGRKKKPAKKPAAKKKSGKKRGWGGKKSFYRKKGGGGKSKPTRGASNNNRSRGSNEEYSRKDPLLKNVGGASIIF